MQLINTILDSTTTDNESMQKDLLKNRSRL